MNILAFRLIVLFILFFGFVQHGMAQRSTKVLVAKNPGTNTSVVIKKGRKVIIRTKNTGVEIKGRIQAIGDDHIVINGQNYQLEDITSFGYFRKGTRLVGHIILGAGLVFIGTGLAVITLGVASLALEDSIEAGLAIIVGMATAVLGIPPTILGIPLSQIKNVIEPGTSWDLVIEDL